MTDVSLAVGVGLLCGLLSAVGTNLAFLFKHRGAVAAPDVEMLHPLRSAIDLFRSKWWRIGWGVAAVAFALHVAALTLRSPGAPPRVPSERNLRNAHQLIAGLSEA